MKHTMVRTALRHGAVFEISYAGALDSNAKRNWWATAREVARVTKGKGLIVTGGGMDIVDLRAPKDIGNLVTFLGLPQNLAHDTTTITPKSLLLRAQTRKTYRAVFSEPKLVIPGASVVGPARTSDTKEMSGEQLPEAEPAAVAPPVAVTAEMSRQRQIEGRLPKRSLDNSESADGNNGGGRKKRKSKKSG